MRYTQRNIPSPNPINIFNITEFNGGLNNTDGYIELENNQSPDMLNIDFYSERGVIKKRKGFDKYDSTNRNKSIEFLDTFVTDEGTELIMQATNSEFFVHGTKVIDVSGTVHGVSLRDKYYFVDGTHFYVYGKFPQANVSPYLEVKGIAISGYTVMKIIEPDDNYTQLDDSHVIGKTVYNYTDKTVQYQPCKKEVESLYLGTNQLPNKPKYILARNAQLFVAGDDELDSEVFISHINSPYYFPSKNQISVDYPVIALYEFHNAAIVGGGHNDIYAIYGASADPSSEQFFNLKHINTHTGFINDSSAVRAHNYLLFLGNDGKFYSLNTPRTDTDLLNTTQISNTIDLLKAPIELDKNIWKHAKSIFYKDLYLTSIDDKILVYSYNLRAWGLWNGLDATSFTVSNNNLILGTKDGRLLKENEIYNDDGNAIVSYYKTKRFHLGYAARYKYFKDIAIVTHVYDNIASSVKIDFEVDYQDVKDVSTIRDIVARWGTAKFGDRLIGWNISKSLPIVVNRRGRLIRFIFGNEELDETFKVYEINGQYELKGFRY